MARVYALLPLLYFAFLLYCLLDAILSEQTLVRNLPKLMWVVLIVLIPVAGGIAWLVAGRPEGTTATPGSTRTRSGAGRGGGPSRRGTPGRGRPAPPKGPDDDPEFLRRLDEQLRRDRPEDDEPADD